MRILILRLVSLCCLTSMLGFAGSWSGVLVDSKCYASRLNDRSDTPSWVNWDRGLAVRYCSPNKKTRSFAIVQQDGWTYKLDPAGNEKALALLQRKDKNSLYVVAIKGEMDRNILKVDAILAARQTKP